VDASGSEVVVSTAVVEGPGSAVVVVAAGLEQATRVRRQSTETRGRFFTAILRRRVPLLGSDAEERHDKRRYRRDLPDTDRTGV
jgi:hypothetical protein